jgi:hypothetical protein
VLKKKRFTSYVLLFIFGFLFFKNLLPDVADHNNDNHIELGHIHFYHANTKVTAEFVDSLKYSTNHQQADDDENCSSSKSVFAYSHYPSEIYKITIPSPVKAFDLIFTVTNNFKTPYLDPIRKPPRLA